MRIEHLAMYVRDLEVTRAFYETHFGATSNAKYTNERTGFSSYFLSFEDGARLEIMHNENQLEALPQAPLGYHHLALSVGSKEEVDALTARLVEAGSELLSGPRTTGDGYYESVITDPDGNRIEMTV